MPVQIQPEPPEEIRAALVRLLAAELEGRGSASPWWLEGLRESVEDAAGHGETAAPPRSSRGATRA